MWTIHGSCRGKTKDCKPYFFKEFGHNKISAILSHWNSLKKVAKLLLESSSKNFFFNTDTCTSSWELHVHTYTSFTNIHLQSKIAPVLIVVVMEVVWGLFVVTPTFTSTCQGKYTCTSATPQILVMNLFLSTMMHTHSIDCTATFMTLVHYGIKYAFFQYCVSIMD